MRFLFYNIAYATGGARSVPHFLMTMHRYLRNSQRNFRRLRQFIHEIDADILGVVEIDSGSFRTGKEGQDAALVASSPLRHHSFASKYSERSMARFLPVLRHQGNAIFSRGPAAETRSHFFTYGFKRLVIESKIEDVTVFLVHLALSRETRRKQLRSLVRLVGSCEGRPVILAGDFNVRGGGRELDDLIYRTGLQNANKEGLPTFPVWQPHRELDFILHSPKIRVENFRVLKKIRLSDHLPIVMDFNVEQ